MALLSFGKKPEAGGEFGGTNVPVSQVLNMKAQGMNNSQIANQLRNQGFSLTQIRDALAQADIKSAVGETPMPEPAPMPDFGTGMPEVPPMPDFGLPPVSSEMPMPEMQPMPSQMPQAAGGVSMNIDVLVNELQRILEEIIEEKWKTVEEKLNALEVWKAKMEEKTSSMSDTVTLLNRRIDEFSTTIASRTEGYTKTIQDVNVQMEAMEKMMGKLVPSLAEEIKELRDVVEKVKER